MAEEIIVLDSEDESNGPKEKIDKGKDDTHRQTCRVFCLLFNVKIFLIQLGLLSRNGMPDLPTNLYSSVQITLWTHLLFFVR